MSTTTKKQAEKNFFDIFQYGVEIEGSFLKDENTLDEIAGNVFDIARDGSINSVDEGGEEKELRTTIISKESEETDFLEALKSISDEYNGDRIFSYRNESCGTHYHIDLNEGSKDEEHTSYSLLALDSIDFERYFFKEYFRTFKKLKFAKRLSNTYCKTYINDIQNDNPEYTTLRDVENRKSNRDRYYWLNTQCLSSGKGIEFRIFPYLQTAEGVKEVTEFVKRTVMSYWKRPHTQKRVKMIEKYYKGIASMSIQMSKLNEYEKLLITSLSARDRNTLKQSCDSIEYIMELYAKKPTAFLNTAEVY